MNRAEKKPAWAMLDVGLRLLIVCAVVAAVISGVNAVTQDRYAQNLIEEKRQAIVRIFGSEQITYRPLTSEGDPVYEVLEGDLTVGYCVELSSAGFGGDIGMTVGFEADRSLRGVSIVSLNETPGLGAKVREEGYLAQYQGQLTPLELGKEIDAIVGATISSRAVLDGVNRAADLLAGVLGGDAE